MFDTTEECRRVNEAHTVLTNVENRAKYDVYLAGRISQKPINKKEEKGSVTVPLTYDSQELYCAKLCELLDKEAELERSA